MDTTYRGQKCFDDWFSRKPIHARSEDGFVLDDDNVGIVEAARRYSSHQRQRVFCDIAQRQPAELAPGKRVEKRDHEGREKAPPLSRDRLERTCPSACPDSDSQDGTSKSQQNSAEPQRN